MKRLIILIISLPLLTGIYSCKKFLNINPPKDSATPDEVFHNDDVATSAMTGIYSRMASLGVFSGDQNSIATMCGLASDEFTSHGIAQNDFFYNEIPPTSFGINDAWSKVYSYIYTSNAILEGISQSSRISTNTKRQLQGEAKFVRAFCYFYLINLFGEVPLNLTTDYRINEIAVKSSIEDIYIQIIADLTDAINLLSETYITTERIRPNRSTARALLSRVYLYTEKWELAVDAATTVINEKSLYSIIDDLDKVFLKNSTEAIWQLMPTAGNNTREGALFILNSVPTYVSIPSRIIHLYEINDRRKDKWTNLYENATAAHYYPYKYKIKSTVNGDISEYSMVIRLAELYLIRAEARAHLSLTGLAIEDLNVIRKRAGISEIVDNLNQAQCIEEVEKQRQFELFAEWGHRWFDLKRTGKAPAVLQQLKGDSWQDTDVLFPIPENEILRNPKIEQNAGY